MGAKRLREFWALVRRQHGVVTRAQLLSLGFSSKEIRGRAEGSGLHAIHRGVYAVGRPELSMEGRWLAAVLACGPLAVLSHSSAAALWRIAYDERAQVEVSVPPETVRRRPGVRVHRVQLDRREVSEHRGIPVTNPVRTVVDLSPRLGRASLETLINEAANRDLLSPDALRAAADAVAGRPGSGHLRRVLDRQTFRLTRSVLERRFLGLVEKAGLPVPETRVMLNGFEVDFYFRDLGLVVETDGLRFHRTPAQQARDRLRDQAHVASGITPLRFTHAQVHYEPQYVCDTLTRVVARLGRR